MIDDFAPDDPKPMDVAKSTKDVLAGLGSTVLTAIDGAIALAIAKLAQQSITVVMDGLEKTLKANLKALETAGIKTTLDQIDVYKAKITPYLKYLDMVPEIKAPLVDVLSYIENIQAEIKSTVDKAERLTYVAQYSSSLATGISERLSSLFSLRELIRSLL
jgi:autotransporter adhesin